jgi:putative transcriptional regulator
MIAMPQLGDPNFYRSVVLMLHHTKDGAMGLIVNSPLEHHTLGSFAESEGLFCHEKLQTTPIYKGGPVEPQRGWILHVNSNVVEKREILPGLFLSGTMESMKKLLETGSEPLKLVLGYAGWSPGQLENEMQQGAWLDAKSSLAYVVETDAKILWDKVLRDMGIEPANLVSAGGVH